MSKIEEIAANLINGNLTDAREAAKGKAFTMQRLAAYFKTTHGWSTEKAVAAAFYLKNGTQSAFNRYCETK
jgi:hypothetical protein